MQDNERLSPRNMSQTGTIPTRLTDGRFVLMALWGILFAIYAVLFALDLKQPQGVLHFGLVSYSSRIWPLAAMAGLAIGFAGIVKGLKLDPTVCSFVEYCSANRRKVAWTLIGSGIIGSLIAVWVLRAFPNSSDEYDYLFQAKTFLAGRLWNPIPPQHEFFAFDWQFFHNGTWTTYYPPGWPLLLAAVQGLQVPAWLASPLLGGILLFAMFKLGDRRDGMLGGVLAVALTAFSPFFLFNAASYFMHVPAAAAGLLFCWSAADFLKRPVASRAWLTGISLGALGLIRPEDVPVFSLPFAAEFLWRARSAHYRHVLLVILGGLPFLVCLALYNHAVVGSVIPNIASFRATSAHFGLSGVNMYGQQRTPLEDLNFAASRIVILAEWSSPILVLGYVAAFSWLSAKRRLSFSDFVFPLLVIIYLFVPFWGGNQYGPRYYFEGFPFVVLTTVSGFVTLLNDKARVGWQSFAGTMVLAHAAICIVSVTVIALFMRTVVDERMDLYDQVRGEHLRNAVVVIRSSTGRILPMGPMELTRNGIVLDGNVIYALDIPQHLKDLQQLFPHRQFYIYSRDSEKAKGTLQPLT